MKQVAIVILILFISLFIFGGIPSLAAAPLDGEKIFSVNCVGCHPQGGNIIRRGKTLQKKALHKYKMDSLEPIIDLVTNGRGNMSAYRERLSQQEIAAVAAYVLERAEKGWR